MNKPKYTVVNFSGGKDSTAMLLRLIDFGTHIDEVVHFDVGKEFPAMYEHIAKVKKLVESNGIKFTTIRSEKSFDYLMFEHNAKRKDGDNSKVGLSWPGPRKRWCTSNLKGDLAKRYFSRLKKEYEVIQYIGIAFDELHRLQRKNNQDPNFAFPLVEWQWTEEQCLQYCYDNGFDFGGLYEVFRAPDGKCPRISCWCCPLQSLDDLRILYRCFPELWQELKRMDSMTWQTFKPNYSVEQLQVRFDLEQRYAEEGKPIRSNAFFDELRQTLRQK